MNRNNLNNLRLLLGLGFTDLEAKEVIGDFNFIIGLRNEKLEHTTFYNLNLSNSTAHGLINAAVVTNVNKILNNSNANNSFNERSKAILQKLVDRYSYKFSSDASKSKTFKEHDANVAKVVSELFNTDRVFRNNLIDSAEQVADGIKEVAARTSKKDEFISLANALANTSELQNVSFKQGNEAILSKK